MLLPLADLMLGLLISKSVDFMREDIINSLWKIFSVDLLFYSSKVIFLLILKWEKGRGKIWRLICMDMII